MNIRFLLAISFCLALGNVVQAQAEHHQQHYSFLPPKKLPVMMPQRQNPILTGRIVQPQAHPTSPSSSSEVLTTLPSFSVGSPSATNKKYFRSNSLQHSKRSPRLTDADSWVDPLTHAEITQLSEWLADYVQLRTPDKAIPLTLALPPQNGKDTPFLATLVQALQKRGYVVNSGAFSPVRHLIRYRISVFDHTLLVRIRINDTEAARLYQHLDSDILTAISPLSAFQGRKD